MAVPIGEGMLPSGDLVVRAASDVVDTVEDDVVMANDVDGLATTGMDVDAGPCVIKGPGTGTGVVEGDCGGGGVSGCGAGMVESAKTLAADVSGCWENVSGAIRLPVVGAEETGGTTGVIAVAVTGGIVPLVPIAGIDVTGTAGVAAATCPADVQVIAVPGAVGSDACGTGASVVSGSSGWVAAENGPGPLSGEDTIAPGVDGSPIAVVPMVEICAKLA